MLNSPSAIKGERTVNNARASSTPETCHGAENDKKPKVLALVSEA
jgi:hypothetical protein